ncbi:MAG: DUF1501 domain-containing protein [Gemmataceae bacterium]
MASVVNQRNPGRREFLRAGLAAFGSLSLPGLFRMRSTASENESRERTAVIAVWLRGGCSHLDTYDPKPEAPTEYRGPFAPIATRTPGLRISELLPRQAKVSHRFALLRSMAHTGGGHPAGSLQPLSGDPDPQDKLRPVLPDFMSVAHRLRSDMARKLPNYVGVNPIVNYDNFTIAGPGYLGSSYVPFAVTGDPNAPDFRVPNLGLVDQARLEQLNERLSLQKKFDLMRREIDRSGTMEAMDRFETQAMNLLTSPETAEAFGLNRESDKLRDRYGRNQWGQQLLMARRLVEAGVEIITSTLDGPLCGRVSNWDDHAVNHHVFDAIKYRAPFFDQAVAGLIEDLYERGLDKRVLVVVTGEFGRTPRISYVASSGGGAASAAAGTVQPGRDHWPRANSMIWAGGGITTGQVIGATDKRGEEVTERQVGPQDFLATIYRHLGIDYERVTLPDHSGRPIPIVNNGKAITELL